MITRFLLYGALGWIVEIVWTGLGSVLRRDPRLVATTYLWMLPIYGGAGVAFERLYAYIVGEPWWVRGTIWVVAIFAVEYVTGLLLRRFAGCCPWDYSGTRFSVHGLIRLDYAPAWFLLGLVYERVHVVIVEIVPHVQTVLLR